LSEGKALAPEDLAKLSKVKAKIEIVGDYADMEKFRSLVNELSGKLLPCTRPSPRILCD
jgi:hypothetical protein